ncbi:hypothetical protein SRHO_G00305600 [Serrasalmus rhombeus]
MGRMGFGVGVTDDRDGWPGTKHVLTTSEYGATLQKGQRRGEREKGKKFQVKASTPTERGKWSQCSRSGSRAAAIGLRAQSKRSIMMCLHLLEYPGLCVQPASHRIKSGTAKGL